MDQVVDNYFDQSRRELNQLGSSSGGPGGSGNKSSNGSSLPPIVSADPMGGPGSANSGSGGQGGGGPLLTHNSFDLSKQHLAKSTREQVLRNLLEERYEEILRENEKIHRKLRNCQDQLSIVSAKKHAYKTQSEKSERDLEALTKAFETLKRDGERIQEENNYWSQASRESINMMNEMRNNHITEVRLLQRGLASRNDEGSKNKINEMADLLDKLGKSIVQRDDAMREKTKLKSQLHQARTEIATLQEERRRTLNQSKKYQHQLAEATRANKVLLGVGSSSGGGGGSGAGDASPSSVISDLSDVDFEEELTNFERRYQVRDEGARGLDSWVESLHKERNALEKTKTEQQELIHSLEKNIKSYHILSEQKDSKFDDLEIRFLKVQEEYSRLQTQVASKQSDLEFRIEAERRNFETRIKRLQSEFEHASATSMGYQSLNEKLQSELLRVHDSYTQLEIGANLDEGKKEDLQSQILNEANIAKGKPTLTFPEERSNRYDILSELDLDNNQLSYFVRDVIGDIVNKMAKKQGFGHLAVTDQFAPLSFQQLKTKDGNAIYWTGPMLHPHANWNSPMIEFPSGSPQLVASQASFTRTSELLNMEVWVISDEALELRAHEVATNEKFTMDLPHELLEELDEHNPWAELFQMVGLKQGPPRVMVFPTLLGRKETYVNPNKEMAIILTIYQYDFSRYYINLYHVESARLADLVLTEENIPEEFLEKLKPYIKINTDFVYEFIRKYLFLSEKAADAGQTLGAFDLSLKWDAADPFVPGQD